MTTMRNLLLEIGLEEMPAKIVTSSSEQLLKRIADFLEDNRITYGDILPFSTPRRLAVIVKEVADVQENIEESVKGPAKRNAVDNEGNWTEAAIGFVRRQSLTTDDIYLREIKGIEYIHVNKFIEGKPVMDILPGLRDVVMAMTFPVSMHWADHTLKYIRPIHWITAMLDETVIPFEVVGIKTSNTSFGHRFLGKEICFNNAMDYESILDAEYVVADSKKRRNLIVQQITILAETNHWSINLDEDLLEEINNLVEYPTAFFGEFDKRFLEIPDEVLITSMKDHQRYFEVRDQAGTILPYFISVRNGISAHIENVAKGNEKVLAARLDDARFFYDEDKKGSIQKYTERLKQVTFHVKIGSIYEKMHRVSSLAQIIGLQIGLTKTELSYLSRASAIYKFDLVTNMVGEFPELQGIMGEKYAFILDEQPAVAQAIREHYLPISSEGELPRSTIGAVLAVADKLDTLMAFFAVGLVPTSSNDPFALRRQTYGIVRIVIEKGWSFPFQKLRDEFIHKSSNLPAFLIEGFKTSDAAIHDFIKARIRQLLSTENIRHDVIEATLNSDQDDLNKIVETGYTLQNHLSDKTFKTTIEALTRVLNIASKNESLIEDSTAIVNTNLFETASEHHLYDYYQQITTMFEQTDMESKYNAIEQMQPFINAFFNENMVITDNKIISNNRLALLLKITKLILSFASVDQLVTK